MQRVHRIQTNKKKKTSKRYLLLLTILFHDSGDYLLTSQQHKVGHHKL